MSKVKNSLTKIKYRRLTQRTKEVRNYIYFHKKKNTIKKTDQSPEPCLSGFVQDVGRKGAASGCVSFEILQPKALGEGRAKMPPVPPPEGAEPLSPQLPPEGLST